jgi:hypothetical protein
VALLPEVGGKMISLRAPTGREWLWQTPRRPYRRPEYGGAFDAYDISGFDECFPGIAESPYPNGPWQGVTVPDHGELWTLPWDCTIEGDALVLAVHGVRFPYRFSKRLSLHVVDGGAAEPAAARPSAGDGPVAFVQLEYRLENLSPFAIRYLWSAHPLFAALPGMRVLLPKDVKVRVDWSKDARLGTLGTEHTWPRTQTSGGAAVTLDTLPKQDAGTADKLYTTRLPTNVAATWCALHDPDSGEYVAFRLDPRQVPYIGVWLNCGGWPLAGEPCFNVALEPCTGFPDRLDSAVLRDEAATLAGSSEARWELRLEVGRGTVTPR